MTDPHTWPMRPAVGDPFRVVYGRTCPECGECVFDGCNDGVWALTGKVPVTNALAHIREKHPPPPPDPRGPLGGLSRRRNMFLILLYLVSPSIGWACAGNSDMLRDPAAVRGAILAGQCEPFLVEEL